MEALRSYAASLIMALVLIEQGSCFLYRKSEAPVEADSEDISHLNRRYWNDDIRPCIEKFCERKTNKNSYVKCLMDYCPGSLVIVPRDLDDTSLYPVTLLLGDTEMCARSASGDDSDCVGKDCGVGAAGGGGTGRGMEDKLFNASPFMADPVRVFKARVFKICQEVFCGQETSEGLAQCTSERCCGVGDVGRSSGLRDLETPLRQGKAPVELLPMARKRRIIDEVSQCIQSYCSGKKASKDRIMCIIEKCNRMK